MSGHQTQIEKLTADKIALQERIEKLEKDLAKREYRKGLKERPFWKTNASFWFHVTESEFKAAGVTDDHTKYNYVVSQLDEETTEKVKDIIKNPPIFRGKYEKIKEVLKLRLEEPEHERMRRLFEEKLEDRTPSQFYRHLQYLAGGTTVDKILLHLWLRRLPVHCQEILASRLEQTNIKLAEIADNIMEATKASENSISHNTLVDNIQQSVDELGKQVIALGVTVKRQSRSRSRSTSKTRTGGKPPVASPKVCWYHQQWGENAYRCIEPCSWKKSES